LNVATYILAHNLSVATGSYNLWSLHDTF